MFNSPIDSATVTVYTTPMEHDESELSIEALAERVGVPLRTIRFYIARGLLPGPGSRGKSAAYGEEHLLRLQLIRRLSESRVPLEEIRTRLGGLSLDEVRLLLAEEDRRGAELQVAERAPSPKEYVSALLRRAQAARQGPLDAPSYLPPGAVGSPLPSGALGSSLPASPLPERSVPAPAEFWQRWELTPGVELHVRGDVARQRQRLIERLRAVAESFE
ncbi:MAG TPA: MerR family transcriptional regulator [Chloroflexota bacterium]